MPKITKRTVDGLTPGASDTFEWDDEIKGFGVRCRPSGAKTYLLKTRIGGAQRWLTIGRHGSPWTPETARGPGGEVSDADREHAALKLAGASSP
jgi:hypothetical protein